MMTSYIVNLKMCLLNFVTLFSVLSLSHARPNHEFPVRAVNLGGWLVTEGSITPSLFDAIPNNDLLGEFTHKSLYMGNILTGLDLNLHGFAFSYHFKSSLTNMDGTSLRFKSVTTKKYLTAKSGGGNVLLADSTGASDWETFTLWRINENTFRFRVFNKQFVGLDRINVVAVSNTPIHSGTFQIVRKNYHNSSRVRIIAPNGYFLQAKTEELVIANVSNANGWENDDPTIFEMTTVATIQGEFQLTNGYGSIKAPQIMKEHWNTFIVEDDFKFMATHGLHAARIPVGWWIASDPHPPPPYVGGSLHALDNAFKWAEKYGFKIIIDLHAAPGSQNGFESSSSRDGSLEWGNTYENIKETVDVIDFLTSRYTKRPSLFAVELLNEPKFPGVTLESLTKYYKDGYEAVRKHSSTAYVVFSNRFELSNQIEIPNTRELFSLAKGLKRCVIDVHYYSLFYDIFNNMTVQENIDYIYNNRSSQLNFVTTSDGPLTFVGEWVAEWKVEGASKEDYKRFAKAELDVFGQATFGWSYWTLKSAKNHWSLEWMIKNGYIKF